MSFSVEELKQAIQEKYNEQENVYYGDAFMAAWYEEWGELDTKFGKVTVVDGSGGEGDGAPISVVFQVGERFFEMDGYYSSWGDSQMDGSLFEVVQKQVTVTQYMALSNE